MKGGIKMHSADDITKAKKETKYRDNEPHHGHDDCIRMAYEWLDAQTKTKNPTKNRWALKHIIENWAGRYISQSDVEVAAHMHPEIIGSYPFYNISSRLTEPSQSRLSRLPEAGTHWYKNTKPYKVKEDDILV